VLRVAEAPYAAAMRARNARYDDGRAIAHRVAAPVISVGNLTLGGVGKTPLVEWLARWLLARGVKVAIVSRGYGAEPAGRAPVGGDGRRSGVADARSQNDEARELAEKLPAAPHFQHRDRLLACQTAIDEAGAELLLLDDGFQHRRLARDLDLALVDACEPFGFEHVFPRGTLREPLAGVARAHAIALTRADMLPADERDAIRRRYQELAPAAAWLELWHRPAALRSTTGEEISPAALRGTRVAAVCGIGNPRGFRHTLDSTGCQLVAFREYPDHHRYTQRDLGELAAWADSMPAQAIVCTHKDLVKIPAERLGRKPLWALRVEAEITTGRAVLEGLLQGLVDRRQRPHSLAA
jgi:tetraacyldisaccharide 4'-kinase